MPGFFKLEYTTAGGSTDPSHAGWMNITSFSWGLRSRTTGRDSVHDMILIKVQDQASPTLFQLAASGEHAGRGILDWPGTDGRGVMSITLEDTVIASIRGAGSNEQGMPLEMMEISFRNATVTQGTSALGASALRAAGVAFSSATTALAKTVSEAVARAARGR